MLLELLFFVEEGVVLMVLFPSQTSLICFAVWEAVHISCNSFLPRQSPCAGPSVFSPGSLAQPAERCLSDVSN